MNVDRSKKLMAELMGVELTVRVECQGSKGVGTKADQHLGLRRPRHKSYDGHEREAPGYFRRGHRVCTGRDNRTAKEAARGGNGGDPGYLNNFVEVSI